ncbi:hypothetical protein ACFV0R_13030 [Streptomyces sp. NPDC059578]|uniref:hypothetical protein n=1 Tax=unclassified Streptomyces TaxID=2593676 RepID=UPI0036696EA0
MGRTQENTGGTLGGTDGGVVREVLTRLNSPSRGTIMVALINDGGETYLDTVPNDDWMRARGLLSPENRAGDRRTAHHTPQEPMTSC